MWGTHTDHVPLSIVAPGQFRSDTDQLLGDPAKAPDARPATAADALQRLMALDVSPLRMPRWRLRPPRWDTLDGCISPEEPALASTPPNEMDDLITKTAPTSSVSTSTLIWGLPRRGGHRWARRRYFLIGDGNSTGPSASNQVQTELTRQPGALGPTERPGVNNRPRHKSQRCASDTAAEQPKTPFAPHRPVTDALD